MRKFLLLSCITALHYSAVIAQDSLTLVDFNDLTFSNDLEKKLFADHFIDKKTDVFLLFMANGVISGEKEVHNFRDKFYQHLMSLKGEKIQGKRNDKKTRLIYDDIHKSFFRKYEEKNRFEDIFHYGYYNCVSASALYALAFEELNIPYVIKELPSHVYLIAYPNGEQIKIETTSPVGGFQTIDPSFKQAFVKMLKDQKLITTQEYAAGDVNRLFDKFYFSEQKDISLLNLVGIQYINDALYKYDDEKFEEAFAQAEKGYLFDPNERSGYLLMTTGTAAFEKRKQRDSLQAVYLAKLSRYHRYGVTEDMIQGEFGRATQELLFEKNKKEQLDQYFKVLIQFITDADLKSKIKYLYHYENGRLLYNQAKYKEALPYFETALQYKPEHMETNTAFVSALGQLLSSQGNNLEVIASLEKYAGKYRQLRQNNIFNVFMASAYLVQFGMEYTMEKSATGDKYRLLFEEQLDKFPDLAIQNSIIGQAYSAAAVYYFRRGQTSKAKKIIEKGLAYSPNNPELLIRQQMIK